MKYNDYKVEDFLKDEFFVQWVRNKRPDANHFWEKWLEQHPEHRAILLEAREIIMAVQYGKTKSNKRAYNEVLESIYREEHYSSIRELRSSWFSWQYKVAATVLLLCVSIAVFYTIYIHYDKGTLPAHTHTQEWTIKENPAGIKSTFTLGDGTRVTLNANSKLSISPEYGTELREVKLEGEAFFDVTPNMNTPFIVKSDNIITRVLGTSFNISAYPNDPQLNVAVVTGKVNVRDELTGLNNNLLPHDMICYDKSSTSYTVEQFEYDDQIGWKEGIIKFEEASFAEVRRKLSRWYDVDFIIENDMEVEGKFTGYFKDKSLQEIMNGLSFTSEFNYEIKGKEVHIR